MSAEALVAVLKSIQALEHERQWCETEDVSEVETRLEAAVNDLMALLCPRGQEEGARLPAVSGLFAAPAQADALRKENERLREALEIIFRLGVNGERLDVETVHSIQMKNVARAALEPAVSTGTEGQA